MLINTVQLPSESAVNETEEEVETEEAEEPSGFVTLITAIASEGIETE